MKVAAYIAARLVKEGITHVFLVQGAANNDIIYALADQPGIDYICPQHEQSGGFMAEGWAKVTGKTGCVITTSGPGGQNLVTAIANCWYDSVPMLFITGQVNSQFMRRNTELRQLGFQEWPVADCVKPITKYAAQLTRAGRVPWELEKALHKCCEGRHGPVLLDIPLDIQRAELPPDLSHIVPLNEAQLPFNLHLRTPSIRKVVDRLRTAERPVVLVGGGARGTEQALEILAELAQVPLIPTWNALDIVPSDSPYYGGRCGTYGGPGRNFAIQNADFLLLVGCRLSGRITGGKPATFARAAWKCFVDVDLALLDPENQEVKADLNIHCDAGVFVQELERQYRNALFGGTEVYSYDLSAEEINAEVILVPPPQHTTRRASPTPRMGWVARVAEWRDRYDPVLPEHLAGDTLHPYAFARELSNQLPANAVVVTDCGGNVVVMNHAFKTKRGQRFFSNNGNSPMGFSFAAAIGAWFADPTRPVVCVIGDGGMQMNIQELQTLATYGAKVKVFIINNGIYGITQQFQRSHYPGRRPEASGPPGPGYRAPRFTAIAQAYGIDTFTLGYTSDTRNVIDAVLRLNAPVVCDVRCDGFATYEPRIEGWANPLEDMSPRLPREEFRANMIVDPLPGWETGEYK